MADRMRALGRYLPFLLILIALLIGLFAGREPAPRGQTFHSRATNHMRAAASASIGPTVTQEPLVTPTPIAPTAAPAEATDAVVCYIGNTNSRKFHHATCSSVDDTKDSNKVPFSTRQEAIDNGYVPCKRCNP